MNIVTTICITLLVLSNIYLLFQLFYKSRELNEAKDANLLLNIQFERKLKEIQNLKKFLKTKRELSVSEIKRSNKDIVKLQLIKVNTPEKQPLIETKKTLTDPEIEHGKKMVIQSTKILWSNPNDMNAHIADDFKGAYETHLNSTPVVLTHNGFLRLIKGNNVLINVQENKPLISTKQMHQEDNNILHFFKKVD